MLDSGMGDCLLNSVVDLDEAGPYRIKTIHSPQKWAGQDFVPRQWPLSLNSKIRCCKTIILMTWKRFKPQLPEFQRVRISHSISITVTLSWRKVYAISEDETGIELSRG